jgi:hypothetical protein
MSSYQNDPSKGEYQPIKTNVDGPAKSNKKQWVITGAILLVLAIFVFQKPPAGALTKNAMKNSNLPLNEDGTLKLFDNLKRFVMEDYDAKSTFASFLPGVAGYFGKPVWAFYVNRGQGISTFGIESKDYPLLEFNAANKAYQVTPFIGFRTFVRGTRKNSLTGSSFEIEPFSSATSRNLADPEDDADKPKRVLYVGTNEMEIQEIDGLNGLTTAVKYFILPEENFPALVRRATFSNSGDSELELSILDGLAKIEPSGGRLDGMLKSMGRTLEGWFGVTHADESLNMPF